MSASDDRTGRALRRPAAAVLCAFAMLAAGCGDSSSLNVSAEPPLQAALADYAKHFTESTTRTSAVPAAKLAGEVGGSDKPDVVVASFAVLDKLYRAGRIGRPVRFASDELAVITRATAHPKIRQVKDIFKPGVRLAIATAPQPSGVAVSSVLAHYPAPRRKAVLANVRAREPDVEALLAKLKSGAVDGVVLYASEARRRRTAKLAVVTLGEVGNPAGPARVVEYGAAMVKGAHEQAAAKAYLYGLLSGEGSDAIDRSGIAPYPLAPCGSLSLSREACPSTAGAALDPDAGA